MRLTLLPRRQLTQVVWIDPALKLAMDWVAEDDERWQVLDAFLDLVHALDRYQEEQDG